VNTLTKARKLVAQEEAADHGARVNRTARRLEAEANAQRVREQQERLRRRLEAADAEACKVAPVVTIQYGDVSVRVSFGTTDEVQRQVLTEGVKRATRVMNGSFHALRGRLRATAMNGMGYAPSTMETTLVEQLRDALSLALNTGLVEVSKR
jgi:hypothetical protein